MNRICYNCFHEYEENLNLCPHCGYYPEEEVHEALHMALGTRLNDRYLIGRVIGYGGFGVTYAGWDSVLKVKVAVKEYLPGEFSTRMLGQTEVSVYGGNKAEQYEKGMERFVEEAKKIAKFNHEPGIVGIYDSFLANNTAYIIMEYIEGITLTKWLNEKGIFDAQTAVKTLEPMILSLKNIHEAGIIHRDIAPDNIMVNENSEAKLIDFGAARYAATSHSRSLTVIIKEGYSPEEQYRSRGEQGAHTDVYALAATIYKMTTGITPPDAMERRVTFEKTKNDPLRDISEFKTTFTENQENAIMNALNVRIEDRTPYMEQFYKELTSEETVVRRKGRMKRLDLMRWPLWAKISVSSALACSTAAAILANVLTVSYAPVEIPSEMIRVPSVIGETLDDTNKSLKDHVILSEVTGAKRSALVAEDLVMKQDKDSGSYVMQNSLVGLTISTGVESSWVPNVLGMTEENASAELTALGFGAEAEYAYSSFIAQGCVIEQSAAAGEKISPGDTVKLTISKGREPSSETSQDIFEMTDLTNGTYDDACRIAEENGFYISVRSAEYSDTLSESCIIYQSIAAGQEILPGNTVELVVSKGGQKNAVENVFCQSEKRGRDIIESQGFSVGNIDYEPSDIYASGLIISQYPESGTELEPGSQVDIIVSTGKEAIVIPDVSGMKTDEARELLLSCGFAVAVAYDADESAEKDVILSQIPAPDEIGNLGDTIIITANAGKDDMILNTPDVTGKQQQVAVEEMGKAGINTAINAVYSDTAEKGQVIEQNPPHGMGVLKSSVVILTVSRGKEEIVVPDVSDLSPESAMEILTEAGFSNIQTSYEYSGNTISGLVTECRPSVGSMQTPDSQLSVIVSKGAEPFDMPDFLNLSKQQAQELADKNGLTVTWREMYSDSVPKGNVILQTIDPGEQISANERFALVLSLGSGGVHVSDAELNSEKEEMMAGDTLQLISKVSPSDVPDKAVYWSSSNEKAAVVNEYGLVTAVGKGESVITAKTEDGGKTAECRIIVSDSQVESIEISSLPSKLMYYSGEKLDTKGLRLLVIYKNGSQNVITEGFTAECNLTGSGKKTVTVKYGGKTAEYEVTLAETGITVSRSSITVQAGKTFTLQANVTGGNPQVKWSSSDTSVATVSNGVVAGRKPGSCTVTVQVTIDGKTYSDSCTVTVTAENTPDVPVTTTSTTRATTRTTTKTTAVTTKATTQATTVPATEAVKPSFYISVPSHLSVGGVGTCYVSGNVAYDSISWSTSNASVVSVGGGGACEGNSPGTAVITAYITVGGVGYSVSGTITVS
ncbi:MAG: PASTA domain-containing protein [Oscillospiraceae bacterium]|nr:PASTA domain-containing protein [Oscillospiraceae bacterium]